VISGISLARMRLSLGEAREAHGAIADLVADPSFAAIPPRTRLRAATLLVEACLGAGTDVSAASRILEEARDASGEGGDPRAFASLALARAAASTGDPVSANRGLESARTDAATPYCRAFVEYQGRALGLEAESDEDFMARLEPLFSAAGRLTEPEVLARVQSARRRAEQGCVDEAAAALEELGRRVDAANHPLWCRWVDEAMETVSLPRARLRLLGRLMADPTVMLTTARRVDATIVFSDLVGFTERANHLSPEGVLTTARTLFELSADLLSRHGLHVIDYLGDGVLAMASGAGHEDRALCCCRDLVRRMGLVTRVRERLHGQGLESDESTLPMVIRCGVATGPVVVGMLGSMSKMDVAAIGMTTNRASRLQQLAGPDEVLCDEGMRSGLVEHGTLEHHQLKGVDGPCAVRRLRPLALD